MHLACKLNTKKKELRFSFILFFYEKNNVEFADESFINEDILFFYRVYLVLFAKSFQYKSYTSNAHFAEKDLFQGFFNFYI